jgi:isoleucyl-tRNA synthetase
MFKPVPPDLHITQMEEGVLRTWKHRHIFEKSKALHPRAEPYVFYEDPPTANAKPELQHVLSRAYTDMFPRFWTMRGFRVLRRSGWDTHGLPVEIQVERQLGFTSKFQIEEYGVDRFNHLCRESAFTYIQDWEKLIDRIAFWVDLDEAYVTYTKEYIESLWWILKSLWDKDLLYQGFKVIPYCPRCGTPLSDPEVAQGHAKAVDPSVYVRLPLVDDPGTSLLVWTATPWTLVGNVAVAAHPEADYVIVEHELPGGEPERLILARALLEEVFKDAPVKAYETFKGKKLKDLRYRPLFTFLLPDKKAHYVILGDFVDAQEGTGLVHIAPAFGAGDMQAAVEHDLPVLQTVTPAGEFIPEVRPWSGKFVKDADPFIIQDLEERGLLYKAETYTHTYPFCWCCDTPLLYYARETWFLRTTQYKDKLVALNQNVNWIPGHIRDAHFGNWLENNVDWALGRERFWGTPLPIWECESCHHQHMVGSIAELSDLAGSDLSGLDLHRPHVDEIHFPCPQCGQKMQRVPEVIDVWFDSGSMPLAQWQYPFDNREVFKEQFPADFIAEGTDQTRGWFYALHAISTLLFEKISFKNVICLGLILDENGQKMSKSRDNLVDPWEVINVHGSDALRWYLYTAGPPGQDKRFSPDLVAEVVRNLTLTLWNVYSFFVTYARLDGWIPPTSPSQFVGEGAKEGESGEGLDRWLLSELHMLVRDLTAAYENYDAPGATRPIQAFVKRLSNWYLRRSRHRFWKSDSDDDKNAAYATLYEALVTLSKLLAPAMPLLADEIYHNLVASVDPGAPESVHLATWPEVQAERIDETLHSEMALVMQLASLGHAARNLAGIKVRQPLSEAAFAVARIEERPVLEKYAGLLADELNVKQIRSLDSADQVGTYQLNPLPEQLGKKYRSRFPAVREALLRLDATTTGSILISGDPIQVVVGDELLKIQPHEVEVRSEPRPGLVVASEGSYLAALNTDLTPELLNEGLAREFVRRVQVLRKEAGLDISDRIYLFAQVSSDLAEALQAHRDYIKGETRALELSLDQPPPGVPAKQIAFSGEKGIIGIDKQD